MFIKYAFISVVLIQLAYSAVLPKAPKAEDYLEEAKRILKANILIDGHDDWPFMLRRNFDNKWDDVDLNNMTQYLGTLTANKGQTHTDITRLREGHVGGFFWVAYASCDANAKDAVMKHLDQVDIIRRLVEKSSDTFEFVTSVAEIRAAFAKGKISSLIGVESGHALDSSTAVLRTFYELGARYVTLTHNCDVPWATNNLADVPPNSPNPVGGLTEFGKKMIAEMNRLGMIVDISHTSYKTQLDTLAVAKAPVIYSHSSVFSICNHTRNVRDDVLDKLKLNRGVIMIVFLSSFVNCNPNIETTLEMVVDHINYVKNRIGVDHIGIGSDYDGMDNAPKGLEDVSRFPYLFAKLLENGWTEQEIAKVAGENLLRAFSEIEEVAKQQKIMEPIDDYIPSTDLSDKDRECRTSF